MPEAPARNGDPGGPEEPVTGEKFRGFLHAGECQERGSLPLRSSDGGGEGFGGKRAAGL